MRRRIEKLGEWAIVVHGLSWVAVLNCYVVCRYRATTSYIVFGLEVSPGTHAVIGALIMSTFLLSAVVGGVYLIAQGWQWLHAWRRRPSYCDACGYDLRATPQCCPECGRRVAVMDTASCAARPPAIPARR